MIPEEIEELVEYGKQLAETIDWEAVLNGTDERFRVESNVHTDNIQVTLFTFLGGQ